MSPFVEVTSIIIVRTRSTEQALLAPHYDGGAWLQFYRRENFSSLFFLRRLASNCAYPHAARPSQHLVASFNYFIFANKVQRSLTHMRLEPQNQLYLRIIINNRYMLSSAEARRMSASVGNLVATVPEVLADLSGAIGNKVRRELPDSDLVRRIWNSIRDLRDVHGVSEAAMANIVPESWRDSI